MSSTLDTRQLRTFAALARAGGFTLAARQLSLSQSAVSHSIRALEEEVGCRLLDRMGKKVVLTQAGEQLLVYAERILGDMATARKEIQHLGQWGRSRLRVGASTTACEHILPAVFHEFKSRHPECLVTIEPGDTPHSIEGLLAHRIDLAFALEPRGGDSVEFHPLFSDELFFLVGPGHAWAVRGQPLPEEIPRQHYILYSKNSYTFRIIESYFAEEAMVLNTVIELGSMAAIKEMVKLGLGISISAPWIVRREVEDRSLCVLPMGRRKLRRTWGIQHLRKRPLSLPEQTFLDVCRQFCATIDEPRPERVAC